MSDVYHLGLACPHFVFAASILAAQRREYRLAVVGRVRVELKSAPFEGEIHLVFQFFHGIFQPCIANCAPRAGDVWHNINSDVFYHFARDTPSFRAGKECASCVSATRFSCLPSPLVGWVGCDGRRHPLAGLVCNADMRRLVYDLDFSDASCVQRVSLRNAQSMPIECRAAAGAHFNRQAHFLQGLIQRPSGGVDR